jgi:hypothetical protein
MHDGEGEVRAKGHGKRMDAVDGRMKRKRKKKM